LIVQTVWRIPHKSSLLYWTKNSSKTFKKMKTKLVQSMTKTKNNQGKKMK